VQLSEEFARLGEVFGWELDDVAAATRTAVDAAFLEPAERDALADEVGRGFASLRP